MKVMLSIKPEFIKEIIQGNKKYEYRKRIFKRDIDTVIVYATRPIGKIIGEFKIGKILNDTPEKIWSLTQNESGISKDFFMEYFSNKDSAFALQIENFNKYEFPIDPYIKNEKFYPPQSYMYVE